MLLDRRFNKEKNRLFVPLSLFLKITRYFFLFRLIKEVQYKCEYVGQVLKKSQFFLELKFKEISLEHIAILELHLLFVASYQTGKVNAILKSKKSGATSLSTSRSSGESSDRVVNGPSVEHVLLKHFGEALPVRGRITISYNIFFLN